MCWRGYATVNLLSDSSHEQTIDTEDKRDARALIERYEAAAVTQAKLSDVSFKGGGKRRVFMTLEADVRGENDSSGT